MHALQTFSTDFPFYVISKTLRFSKPHFIFQIQKHEKRIHASEFAFDSLCVQPCCVSKSDYLFGLFVVIYYCQAHTLQIIIVLFQYV